MDPIVVALGFNMHNDSKSDLVWALLSVDDDFDLYFVTSNQGKEDIYDIYLIPREVLPDGFVNKKTRIDKNSASVLGDIVLGLYERYFTLKIEENQLLSDFELIARQIGHNTVEFYARPTYNKV